MKKIVLILIISGIFLLGFISEEPKKEWPTGKVNMEEILKASPDWKDKAEAYNPDPVMIEYLQQLTVPVKIVVYYGHWCSDSIRNVPRFMQIMHLTSSDSPEVEYWSVPRKPKGEKFKPINNKQLERVPTFVVFVDGKEVGEIVENPKETIEKDLVEILKKALEQ